MRVSRPTVQSRVTPYGMLREGGAASIIGRWSSPRRLRFCQAENTQHDDAFRRIYRVPFARGAGRGDLPVLCP